MRLGLGLGIVKSAASIYKGILDKYPNAVAAYSTRKLKTSYPTTLPADYGGGAAAAYSLRKVKSDYEGSAVKVRRSSDGELQDIGFDSNGNLDTTALLDFVNASGNAYTSDFRVIGDPPIDQEDMTEVGGTGVGGQSIADVSEAYKFTQDSSTGVHRAVNPVNTNIVGGNISISFDYYLPSGQTSNRILFRTNNAGDAQVDLTTTDDWTTYSTTFSGIAGDQFWFYSAIIGQGLSFAGNGSDHFYLKNIVVTQTDADGAVTKWYDQSGNDNDATNTTDSEQPLIVEGGNVVTENGKAALDFDGSAQVLQNSVGASDLSNVSMFVTAGISQTNDDATIVTYPDIGNNAGVALGQGGLGTAAQIGLRYRISGVDIDTDGIALTTGQKLLSALCTASTTAELFENGAAGALNVSARLNFSNFEIGAAGNSAFHFDGTIQEIVIFESDQSSNRKDIEWNINNHYSIYEDWDRESCMNVRRSSDNATQDIGFSGKNINQTQLESFVNDASPVLDDYTGDDAAAAAYSLRKIRTAYEGSAIKVRRSSDDTEQDIGFDANGDLDTTALTTFVNEETNAYTSDFSVTEDLSEFNGTGAAAQSIAGVDDAYKFTLSGGSVVHFAILDLPEFNQTYSVTLDYYIPSGQTVTDIEASLVTTSQHTLDSVGDWTTETFTFVASDDSSPNNRRIRFVTNAYTDVNADGDVFYLKNIVVTQTTADGHVTTWYDQSGNDNRATADCSNPSACEQPLIVEAGDVVLENNKPAIKFDGVDDNLQKAFTLTNPVSHFVVAQATNSGDFIIDGYDVVNVNSLYTSSTTLIRLANGVSMTKAYTTGTQAMFSSISKGTDSLLAVNGSSTTQTLSTNSMDGVTIGAAGTLASGYNLLGTIQEVIIFDSDQSSNRLSIEGNIGRYYNITGYRDGFVTKWYDQSGEYNHAENSTHDEQPQIVRDGSMLKENGKPAILSATLFTQNLLRATFTLPQPLSIVGVVKTPLDRDQVPISSQNTMLRVYRRFNTSDNFLIQAGNNVFTGSQNLEQSLEFTVYNGSSGIFALNGSLLTTADFGTNGLDNLDLFQSNGSLPSYETYLQEVIVFASDQSGNRTDIEKNINTHFKIYS